MLGFKDPLNETLYRPDDNAKPIAFHVVGVVKDFNYSSMHEHVGPLVIELGDNWGSMALRINTKNIPSLISQVETKWNSMAPGQPFSYTFMDNDFNNIYNAEQRTGKAVYNFCCICHFYCMPWFIWFGYICSRATKKKLVFVKY